MKYSYTKIAHFILDAWNKIKMTDGERRVFGALIRLTWGYNRKEALITYQMFADQTGIDRRHMHKHIKSLIDRKMVRDTQSGVKKGIRYRINKNTDEWLTPSGVSEILTPSGVSVRHPVGGQSDTQSGGRHLLKKDIKKVLKKREIKFELPEWMEPFQMEWNEYLLHRKKMKKVPTEYAKRLACGTLKRLQEKGFSPDHVINTCIENGWQGFWEPKGEDPNGLARLRKKYATVS